MPSSNDDSKDKNYGAINDVEVDSGFDETNTYYLKGASDTPLTFHQRLRKALLVAVPLIAAVLIIGGATLFLLRDFSHLYPSHGGSGGLNERESVYHGTKGTTSVTSSSSSSSSSETMPSSSHASSGSKLTHAASGAACADHPQCASSGLTGDCCPSAAGDMLYCCN